MTEALERKRLAIQARRDASTFPGEVEACDAALARLDAQSPTRAVVLRKEQGNRPGPRAVALLLPHQRTAWLCLASGAGNLTKTENSFLHRMRESRYISPRQQDWLRDIQIRLRWEAGR